MKEKAEEELKNAQLSALQAAYGEEATALDQQLAVSFRQAGQALETMQQINHRLFQLGNGQQEAEIRTKAVLGENEVLERENIEMARKMAEIQVAHAGEAQKLRALVQELQDDVVHMQLQMSYPSRIEDESGAANWTVALKVLPTVTWLSMRKHVRCGAQHRKAMMMQQESEFWTRPMPGLPYSIQVLSLEARA